MPLYTGTNAQGLFVQTSQLIVASGNTSILNVANYHELALDINLTGKQGTSPNIQFFLDRVGLDTVNYNLWTSSVITAFPNIIIQSFGSGFSNASSFGMNVQFRWVIGGTSTPGWTYSVSLIAKQ